MTRRKTTLLAGALLGAMALSGLAHAQPAPPPTAEARKPVRDPSERLRALLQLRPAQEPALQAFVAATKRDGRYRQDKRARMPAEAPRTTLERLDRMEARMAERSVAVKRRIDATRAFYAQLDPAQKKAFDVMPRRGHGKGHGRMMKGGHHRMGPPPPSA